MEDKGEEWRKSESYPHIAGSIAASTTPPLERYCSLNCTSVSTPIVRVRPTSTDTHRAGKPQQGTVLADRGVMQALKLGIWDGEGQGAGVGVGCEEERA